MNLQRPNANDATRTANRSRSVVPMSGICSRCIDGCTGNCEVFKATFRGRELIYPGPFGEITAGGDKDYPVDYSHLNIQGYALGAKGLPAGVTGDPDTALFPSVDTETEYGWDIKVKMKVPIFTCQPRCPMLPSAKSWMYCESKTWRSMPYPKLKLRSENSAAWTARWIPLPFQ